MGPSAPVFGTGPELDGDAVAFEMGDDIVERRRGDQAEIAGSRRGPFRLGLEFVPRPVQVDLLPAEMKRDPAVEIDPAQAERALVEPATRLDILDRQDKMIDAVDRHRGGHRRALAARRGLVSRATQSR